MAILKTNCPTLVYNNVVITEIVRFVPESIPQYDEMGNLKYVQHRVLIEGFIDGSKALDEYAIAGRDFRGDIPDYKGSLRSHSTDELSHVIKWFLTQPRKSLHINGSGWGDVHIFGEEGDLTSVDDSDLDAAMQNTGTDAREDGDLFSKFDDNLDTTARVHRDVNFGPKPTLYSFTPIAQKATCRVEFEITFCTLECLLLSNGDGLEALGRVLSFYFDVEYGVNSSYLTERSVRGKVLIANNTVAGNLSSRFGVISGTNYIEKNVDSIRDQILLNFDAPPYFKRTKQTFRVEKDRAGLTFDIVDTEVDSTRALPEDVVDIEVTHTLQTKGVAFAKWDNQLAGSLTLHPGIPDCKVIPIVQKIIRDKVRNSGNQGADVVTLWNKVVTSLEEGKWSEVNRIFDAARASNKAIPISLVMEENLFKYTKRFSFVFKWQQIVSNPADIYAATNFLGIMRDDGEAPLYDWEKWKNSLFLEYNSRGQALLVDELGTFRVVVDTCSNQSNPTVVSNLHDNEFKPTYANKPSDNGCIFNFDPFTQGGSVEDDPLSNPPFEYQNWMKSELESRIQKYQQVDGEENEEFNLDTDVYGGDLDDLPPYNSSGSSEGLNQRAGRATRTIKQHTPERKFTLYGNAARYYGNTPAPKIEKYGGADVELLNEQYVYTVEESGAVPVYRSAWIQEYIVKGEITSPEMVGKGGNIPPTKLG